MTPTVMVSAPVIPSVIRNSAHSRFLFVRSSNIRMVSISDRRLPGGRRLSVLPPFPVWLSFSWRSMPDVLISRSSFAPRFRTADPLRLQHVCCISRFHRCERKTVRAGSMSLNANCDLYDRIVMLSFRNRTLPTIHTGIQTNCETRCGLPRWCAPHFPFDGSGSSNSRMLKVFVKHEPSDWFLMV